METSMSVVGQGRSWSLLKKLGEGDAGEVYLVESLLEQRQAILKRPRRSAFSSEIIRQASQIENEGRILRALNGLKPILPRSSGLPKVDIRVPLVLDQSQPGTEFSDRFFIIIEKASGFDLNFLARLVHLGIAGLDEFLPEERTFLKEIADNRLYPDLILLRALTGILYMFDAIHKHAGVSMETGKSGIVWNDVKPEHIYWDPSLVTLTVIDWGNAQFLEADGYNKDRRISKNDDYTQFIQTFGTFINTVNPEFLALLKWPEAIRISQNYSERLKPFKNQLGELLKHRLQELKVARQLETGLVQIPNPEPADLRQLFDTQHTILAFGELPDFSGADRFYSKIAIRLTQEGHLAEFIQLSQMTCHIHTDDPTKWQALTDIAQVASLENTSTQPAFLQAILAGLVDDWASALWDLLSATAMEAEPGWWDEISGLIRQMGIGVGPEVQLPLVILRRNVLLMQSSLQKLGKGAALESNDKKFTEFEVLLKTLREDIIARWEQIEPDPPDSGLAYNDIDRLTGEIGEFVPEAQQAISSSLIQPKAQVKLILEAWEAREYEAARRGLRRLLLWDPDRRRLLLADRAIARAPSWLEKIQSGPQKDHPLLDFVTESELIGRELRNQVGPANWLDLILDTFTQLRKGRKTSELLVEHPEISRVLPWLEALEPRRYIPAQPARSIHLEREIHSQAPDPILNGIQESQLGPGQDILLADPLDTWAPEARGSSARTFTGFFRTSNGQLKQHAVKIMRGDRLEYALPLYREEVQILSIMRDVPGVTPLLECGLIQLGNGAQLPPDNRPINARSLAGDIHRFGPDQAPNFLSILDAKAHQGWLPYLVIPKLDNQENLMWLCDAGYTRGSFLPIEESLRLSLQICDILEVAHERNIVYRDHKLLHYYWLNLYNGVFMIDWNVARYHPEGLSQAEIQFDLVQLGARALHHIFTGRVAPGALADGPNRVEEIEAAAQSYRARWTYDDQRLPPSLKNVLEQLLGDGYNRIAHLREDLHQVYRQLIGEIGPGEPGI
jgi:serine/threonine protein kinase